MIKLLKIKEINWLEAYFTVEGTENSIFPKTEIVYENEDYKYFYGVSAEGFVSFGCISKKPYMGHEAGYRWSSRASVFNTLFKKDLNKQCIEVVAKPTNGFNYGTAMLVNTVLEYLPSNFGIAKVEQRDSSENIIDISYYIVDKKDYGRTYETQPIHYNDGSYREAVTLLTMEA